MSKVFGALLISLIVSLLGGQAIAESGESPGNETQYGALSNGFDVSLSPADASNQAGGPLRVTVRLRNSGPDAIIRWDWPGFYEFTMFDSKGLLVHQVVTKADIAIGGFWAYSFLHGQINQRTFDLSGRYQLVPGDYRVHASTKLYDPGKYGTDPSEWKLIAAPMSNELTIHVSPGP